MWARGEGEGGKNSDGGTGTYTLPQVKQTANRDFLGNTGGPIQCSALGWEVGGKLTREGTHIHLWLIHPGLEKPRQHCQAIILQLKEIN